MNKLFTSLKINSKHTLINRLAVAPMTTTQSNPDGTVSEEEMAWLERLAADGYGMVISCAAAISKDSIAFENQLSAENDYMLAGLSELAKRLKRHKSINIIQLCHAGSRAIKAQPYSASSYLMPQIPNFIPPKALSVNQIKSIVNDFATACKRVEEAGFDGIEFHGANGYLFTQFISTMTNLRNDEYGGTLENRARFAREIVRACRKSVSEDFILGFRISFENTGLETGLDIDENIQIINLLAEDGIDYVHMSHLDYSANSVKYPDQNVIEYVRKGITCSLPLIGVGQVTGYQDAEKVGRLGADMVAVGRAAIGNCFLPKIFADKEELPNQNPFPENHLKRIGISDDFMKYLKKWPVSTLNVVS